MTADPATRIFVAGHRGMVGAAICRRLAALGHRAVVTRNRHDLDLTDQQAVRRFFARTPLDVVVLAAARVGGIHANNTQRAEFIYENLAIATLVVHEAFAAGVTRLLFLGSSCIYPRDAAQPLREEALLSGPLEQTNEPYAVAKIAGIKLCESYNRQYGTDYRCVMPTNLFGPGDNYDLEHSHVLPALIRKFHLAKLAADNDLDGITRDVQRYGPIPPSLAESLGLSQDPVTESWRRRDDPPRVVLWGTGAPYREFLFVDELAEACVHLLDLHRSTWEAEISKRGLSFVNVGCGRDQTIQALAEQVAATVGFDGAVDWDADRPDGTPRKLLDVSRLTALGWQSRMPLAEGLGRAYQDYLAGSAFRQAIGRQGG